MKELENFTMPTPQECGYESKDSIILNTLFIIKECVSKKQYKIGAINSIMLLKYDITILDLNHYLAKFGWKIQEEVDDKGNINCLIGPLDDNFFLIEKK